MEKLGAADGPAVGEEVWVRGRVASVRAKGGSCFLVLRDVKSPFHTVQVSLCPRPAAVTCVRSCRLFVCVCV